MEIFYYTVSKTDEYAMPGICKGSEAAKTSCECAFNESKKLLKYNLVK